MLVVEFVAFKYIYAGLDKMLSKGIEDQSKGVWNDFKWFKT